MTKLCGNSGFEAEAKRTNRVLDVADFGCRLSVLAVVAFGVVPATDQHLVYGQVKRFAGPAAPGGDPSRDEAIVFRSALSGTVGAKVNVLTVQGDDGLIRGLVETVGRVRGAGIKPPNPVAYRKLRAFLPLRPTPDG